MAVDLKRNKEAIVAAWKTVSDPNSDITWAVFGYEGQTNVLKVVDTGDGDIDDMVEEMNTGKIQYAYCRVIDPNTSLSKYILVNWQGEGAPDMLKGRCANHSRDVAALLRGAHLTVNARSEDDLNSDSLLKQVASSSGANYSIHKEKAQKVEESGPIGSVYKKVRPQAEIKISDRDKFWAKTEDEETARREDEKKTKATERTKQEEERREREKRETAERDRRAAEQAKLINEQHRAQKAADQASKAPARQMSQNDVEGDPDEERRQRSESLRKRRAAEAQSLINSRENNPREMFKQRERANSRDEIPATAPRVAVKPKKAFPPPVQQRQPSAPHREPSPPRQPMRAPSPPREPSPPPREPSPEPVREPSPEPVPPPPRVAMVNPMSTALPKRPDSDEEPEAQDWDEPALEDDTPKTVDPYQKAADPAPSAGLVARALYDYQAEDEGELTFDPDEIITNIEQLDEGWWRGTRQIDGSAGLFPSNYVEIISGEPTSAPASQAVPIPPPADVQPDPIPAAEEPQGANARALYDYTAEGEDEISFDPGDLISEIEQLDEGWWTGTAPTGKRGLFPANYVEMLS